MEKLCSKCSKIFDKSVEYCPFDGAKLVYKALDNYCTECGQQHESEFQFCPVHGCALSPFTPRELIGSELEKTDQPISQGLSSNNQSQLVELSEEEQDLFSRSMCPSCRVWKAWDKEGNKYPF